MQGGGEMGVFGVTPGHRAFNMNFEGRGAPQKLELALKEGCSGVNFVVGGANSSFDVSYYAENGQFLYRKTHPANVSAHKVEYFSALKIKKIVVENRMFDSHLSDWLTLDDFYFLS